MSSIELSVIELAAGEVALSQWQAVYAGAAARLSRAAAPKIAASAAAVERILAKGEPVYGINTGFGKLASVRIEDADLAALQRNIVLSHAAGTGAPSPVPVVRLMLALKLASLGQGTSGVRPATVALIGFFRLYRFRYGCAADHGAEVDAGDAAALTCTPMSGATPSLISIAAGASCCGGSSSQPSCSSSE